MSRIVATCLICVGLVTPDADARASRQESGSVVATVGEGVIRAAPDRAFVSILVESRADDPREAQAQNADVMTAVQSALMDSGVAADMIRMSAYDLREEFDYIDGRRTARGDVVEHTVDVTLDDIARVGTIVDLAVSTGATGVTHIRFDRRDRVSLERDALQRAVTDALARADAAAAGAGRTIARVIRIEEQQTITQPPMFEAAIRQNVAVDTPIAVSEIEIRAHVTVTTALRDDGAR